MPTPPEPTPPVPPVVEDEDTVSTEDFATLAEAFAAVPDNGTVVLAANAQEAVVVDDGKSFTFDLNGNTLSSQTDQPALKVENGSVTVLNGKLESKEGRGLQLDTRTSKGTVTVTLGDDVEVYSKNNIAIFAVGNVELNSAATIVSDNVDYAAISGNGSAVCAGTVLNITGGSVVSASETGVFFPQAGELNISGGKIEGAVAVYAKSGNINISGGTLHGTGAKLEYIGNNDGNDLTGDALVIDCRDYPGGNPVVSITGGTFNSDNAAAVASYAKEGLEPLRGFITGGTYSSDVSDLCAEGYKSVGSDGEWIVVKTV